MCRDETKVVLQLGSFSRPDIQIFSAAGTPLGRVLWDGGRVLTAGWTDSEELLVVDDRGRVHRYTCRGQLSSGGAAPPSFSLGAAAESEGLTEVVVAHGVVVARTAAGHMWCVDNVNDPRPHRFPDPSITTTTTTTNGSFGAVHCLCPIPPSLSASGSLEVLVSVGSTVVIIDSDELVQSGVHEGPIVSMAVSPDGRSVAGFAADDVIYIWTANLEETRVSVVVGDTVDGMVDCLGLDESAVPSGQPDDFVWCGTDGVMASWTGVGALLVGVDGGWQWWDVGAGAGAVALVGEVDGVRVVSTHQHVMIRKVPSALVSVLEIGSTSAGALLHDARKLYDARDARAAAELLEVLRCGELADAAAACLAAAAAEMDATKQESLMRAGCYGRAFLALDHTTTTINTTGEEVVQLARTLRVLNALRDPAIALPLTMPQFQALGIARVAARLTARRHYLLAMRICSAVGSSPEGVLVQWACDKIAASASTASDEDLINVLRAKLQGQQGVKWAAVAAHAQSQGRPRLAAALAEHESCAADQVPLLIALNEGESALRCAVLCGDPDLMFQCVYSMWRRLERNPITADAQRRFWSCMIAYPAAAALLATYLRGSGGDADAVLAMWESIPDAKNTAASAVTHVESATAATGGGGGGSDDAAAPITQSHRYREYWNRAKEAYARDERAGREDAKFEGAAAAAALRLMEVQGDVERTSGREGFIGSTVIDTIKQCLRLGMRDHANKLAKEFKVPEKQQMLLSIAAAATQQDWQQMQQMAMKLDRRAPVTMEHFISAARAHGAPVSTVKWFIDRVNGDGALVRRAQLYSEMGLQREAEMLAEQAEMAGATAGVLGSLRDAVGGSLVGSLMGYRNTTTAAASDSGGGWPAQQR